MTGRASSRRESNSRACAVFKTASRRSMGESTLRAGRAMGRDYAHTCLYGTPLVTDRLRIVIAEDNYLVREGTRRLLEDSGQVEVMACVSNAEELLQAVDGLRPDAVLTDIRMPPGHQVEGIDAAHTIRKRHPSIGAAVLSQHSNAAYPLQLLKDGTGGLGYLLKTWFGGSGELLR